MISGLLLMDKPKELSSFAVVREIKKKFKNSKVGHFGTLDPIATGLLIIALGNATKFFDLFKGKSKTYVFEGKLGVRTDTFDITGSIIKEVKDISLPIKELKSAMRNFVGEIMQTPPMFSAKKHKGKPLYKLAREGKTVEREPVKVRIDNIELLEYTPPYFSCEITTSAGTYIRSIVNDMGELLGTGATLTELRRTSIGEYSVEHALSLKEFEEYSTEDKIFNYILPLETIFPESPKIILSPRGSMLAANGTLVPAEEVIKVEGVKSDYFKLFNDEGKFLCLAKPDLKKRIFRPVIVLK